MSAPLSEAEIAAMLETADSYIMAAPGLGGELVSPLRTLAAEVTRLRAELTCKVTADDMRVERYEEERDAARADLARAVELLNEAAPFLEESEIQEDAGMIGDEWAVKRRDLAATIVLFARKQEPRR
jgi:hypothetical protein